MVASGHGGPVTIRPASARPSTCASNAGRRLRRRRRRGRDDRGGSTPSPVAATGASIPTRPAIPPSPPAPPARAPRPMRRPRPVHAGHAHRQRLHRGVHATREIREEARRRVLPGRHQPHQGWSWHRHGLLADLRRRRSWIRARPAIPHCTGVAGACPTTSYRPAGLRRPASWCPATPVRRCASAIRSSSSPEGLDGCCPPGATHAVDSDCATACGNGVIE